MIYHRMQHSHIMTMRESKFKSQQVYYVYEFEVLSCYRFVCIIAEYFTLCTYRRPLSNNSRLLVIA